MLRDAWQRFGVEKLFAKVPQARQRRLLQAMIFGRMVVEDKRYVIAGGEYRQQRDWARRRALKVDDRL